MWTRAGTGGGRIVCVSLRTILAIHEHVGVWRLLSVVIRPAAQRWRVAPQMREKSQASRPKLAAVSFPPRGWRTPVLRAFLTLHAASQLIIGSPTMEVNQDKVPLENEWTFGKAFGSFLQIHRNYGMFLNPECFLSPIEKGYCFVLLS